MQCNYSLLLTLDELQALSPQTKAELAQKSPEFAKLTGTPTPQNPPDKGNPTRQVMQQGNQQIILPDRNQINQQDSPAVHNPMMNGAAPSFVPTFPTQPTIAPLNNGAPQGFPPQPQQVVSPLPGMTFQPPQQQPQFAPPQQQQAQPQQFAPQQQPQFAPQQQQAPVMDVQYVKNTWFSQKIVNDVGPNRASQLIHEAVQHNVIPAPNMASINESNVAAFVNFVNSRIGS